MAKCLKCSKLSHCDCESCIDLLVACSNAFQTCPCWQVDKCLLVCTSAGVSEPVSTRNCGEVVVPAPGAGCPPLPAAPAVATCCEDVEVCIDEFDSVSVNSRITVTRFGDRIIYSFNLQACNRCDFCVTLDTLSVVVERFFPLPLPARWTAVPNTSQLLIVDKELAPGECREFILAGGIPQEDFDPNATYRIIVRANANGSSDCIVVDFPAVAESPCNDGTFTLVDTNSETGVSDPITITESGVFCLDNVYAPTPSRCDATVTNTAQILETVAGTPASVVVATSDAASLTVTCADYTLTPTAEVECGEAQQWCLCKTGSALECTTAGETRRFACFDVVATQQDTSTGTCTLTTSFTFTATCLSYEKEFTYVVEYGVPPGPFVQVQVGNFSLGPNDLDFTSGTLTLVDVVPPAADTIVRVTVSAVAGTYNLSTCTFTASGADAQIVARAVFSNIPTTTCASVVLIRDVLGLEADQFALVEELIADEGCDIAGPSPDLATIQALLQTPPTPAGGLVLTEDETLSFCVEILDDDVEQVVNTATISVSNECDPPGTPATVSTSSVTLNLPPVAEPVPLQLKKAKKFAVRGSKAAAPKSKISRVPLYKAAAPEKVETEVVAPKISSAKVSRTFKLFERKFAKK